MLQPGRLLPPLLFANKLQLFVSPESVSPVWIDRQFWSGQVIIKLIINPASDIRPDQRRPIQQAAFHQ